MKNLLVFTVSILLIYSCSRKPEACISCEKTTVEIGEPVVFTNCSEHTEDISVTVNGLPVVTFDDKTFNHTFTESGINSVRIVAENEKGETDDATLSITVREIQKSDLVGTWNLYKYTDEDITWYTTDYSTPMNVDHVFTLDSVTIDGEKQAWSLSPKGVITFEKINYYYNYTSTYQIKYFYNGEMRWSDGDDLYYLIKK